MFLMIFVIDNKRCLIGSSNLTMRGMGYSKYPNIEAASVMDIDSEDAKR